MNTENLPDLGFDWAQLIDMVMITGGDLAINIVTALAIFFIGKWVAGLLTKGVRTLMQKQEVDKTLETFVGNLVRMVLMVFVIIAAIGAVGVQTTSLIAVLGAAGLAVGLALQGSLSNFAARRPDRLVPALQRR